MRLVDQLPVVAGSVLVKDGLPSVVIDRLIKNYTISAREDSKYKLYSYDEKSGVYSFPRSALNYLSDFIDLRTTGRRINLKVKSNFIPRKAQKGVVSRTCSYLTENLGGVLVAGCGQGKTVLASETVLRMGMSACILVHKEFLAEQWLNAFKMLCPEYRVGILRQSREDTGNDYDVVIASTQSITCSTREYSDEFYNSFGILVADELHRYGSEVWGTAISKFPAMYRLGLTATPHRFDGLWCVLEEHIGKIGIELKADPIPNKVFLVALKTPINMSSIERPWFNDTQRRAKIVSFLAENQDRNEIIARNILKAYKASRYSLIISERRKQLVLLSDILLKHGVSKDQIGMYVGGMKAKDRDVSAGKPILFTTYQMAKEGLDIERLDTLFLATPQGNVEQTVGRILRFLRGKALPITVDFVDTNIGMARGLAYSRLKNYKKLNCVIEGQLV